MESDIPFLENFEDFYDTLGIVPSKYPDLYVDKLDQLWTYPLLEVPPFKHKFYAIKFFLKGKGVLKVGKWKREMVPPTIFVSPPNQIVSCHMEEGEILEYALAISEEFIERHLKLKHFISVFHYFQSEKSIPFKITEAEMADLLLVFDYIYDEYNSENEEAIEVIASAIYILFVKVKRLYAKYIPEDFSINNEKPSKTESLSNRFLTLLNSEFQKESPEVVEYTISYFASKLAVHPNYLSTKLKTETGKTAKEHLDAKLIHNAKTLLHQTDFSVKEIAFKLNFKEPAHFVNFFKKQTAETPREFRKAY